jgi:hypothetical protein
MKDATAPTAPCGLFAYRPVGKTPTVLRKSS